MIFLQTIANEFENHVNKSEKLKELGHSIVESEDELHLQSVIENQTILKSKRKLLKKKVNLIILIDNNIFIF